MAMHSQAQTLLAHAAHTEILPEIQITAHYNNAIGTSDAASQGVVNASLLKNRPAQRPGEVLEFIPGMIVTQHSGEGKANQYFLRGFNLDHGTDFATMVDNVPVNLPSHAHGQGYSDVNFILPELIDRIDYRKGPYFAENGDFASAGSAHIKYKKKLDEGIAQITLGEYGYQRGLLANSTTLSQGGNLLGAIEAVRNDGPWTTPEGLRKLNSLISYDSGSKANGFTVTATAYQNRWTATDQLPQRLIDRGEISRYGTLDPTDGGDTSRYSLAANWRQALTDGRIQVSAYALRYRLDLFSNFTYFQENPIDGDQFEQRDQRHVAGLQVKRLWIGQLGSWDSVTEVGLQTRQDRIQAGLFQSVQRQRTSTTRDDAIRQTSYALYAENSLTMTPWLRTVAGIRADYYQFHVAGQLAANNGQTQATRTSPKLSVIVGPYAKTELFFNVGHGFHSNDARGTLTRIDPQSGEPTTPVPGLVGTLGKEIGVRTESIPGLQSSLALWQLDIGSELVFVGDAGTNEPNRPSRRTGIEWSNHYTPTPWLLIDANFALSRAAFKDTDISGQDIPGAVSRAGSFAVTLHHLGAWSASMQWRYLGRRPLIEDGSAQAAASLTTNLRTQYQWSPKTSLVLDVFNVFNRSVNDIAYFYSSQLKQESAPVTDYHVHAAPPRMVRISWQSRF